ncbi:MAG: hypothetical protein AB1401_00345 [Thermodesulfobacteriota bacterium]
MVNLEFGMSKEEVKKELQEEQKKAKYETMGYNQKDVISALIKEMRLGNVENALYWLQVTQEAGDSWWYIGRRLLIFTYEDCFGVEAAIYSNAAWQALNFTKDSENILFAWVERLCKLTKFWEVEDGQEREWAWHRGRKDIESGKYRPIPSYAKDRHSKSGWDEVKAGGSFDERFSGTLSGRINMIKQFKLNGCLLSASSNESPEKERNERPDDIELFSPKEINGRYRPRIVVDNRPGIYSVESETTNDVTYIVDLNEPSCECPHHQTRKAICKHLRAVDGAIRRKELEDTRKGRLV